MIITCEMVESLINKLLMSLNAHKELNNTNEYSETDIAINS